MSHQVENPNDQFFNGIYQDVWRKLITPGLSEAECDFIENVCGLKPADEVLDIMCGYGRHTIELAKRGYYVTAVDNSPEYINEIASAASAQSLNIETHAESVLTVGLHKQYRAAICMGNSFAFFDKAQVLSLLQKLNTHLAPAGILVINSWMIAEIAIRHFREKDWRQIEEYKYLLNNRFEFAPSRIESEHTIVAADGRVETIHGVDYIFTLSELTEMFASAGLAITGIFSTPRKRPFRMGDNQVYIMAEKQVEISSI